MAETNDQEKTEEATQQRREDFRRRGQVAQSREVSAVLIMLASIFAMWALGRFFLEQMHQVFTLTFTEFAVMSARQEDWFNAFKFALIKSALVVGPLAGILWLAGVCSTLVQIGFLSNEEAMKFDLNKLNPVEGFKRIVSLRALVEGAKSILKICIVSFIVYTVFKGELAQIPLLASFEVSQLLVYIGEVLLKLFGVVTLFMAALAAADYFFQRWEIEKKMRMTKQEVKEELKSREGDPMVRARIRKLQRELASRRMMEDVKKADVIITNPTHIAVAIRYSAQMIAPRIVAKGAGEVAARIKELAKTLNIPIVENKPLARTMFRTLKIGQTIPRELYTAVAEVLSYIYRLKKKQV
jgi:flagellar biosynthesis protein FlhB